MGLTSNVDAEIHVSRLVDRLSVPATATRPEAPLRDGRRVPDPSGDAHRSDTANRAGEHPAHTRHLRARLARSVLACTAGVEPGYRALQVGAVGASYLVAGHSRTGIVMLGGATNSLILFGL